MKHVYEVAAEVRYSAKGRAHLWCSEKLTVLANGDVDAAMKKAKSAMLKMKTPDGEDGDRYTRRATKVAITDVSQVVAVDLL